ncbi:MAG: hypothetical protein ACREKN_05525 [Longimicrobiaceae bacterium]
MDTLTVVAYLVIVPPFVVAVLTQLESVVWKVFWFAACVASALAFGPVYALPPAALFIVGMVLRKAVPPPGRAERTP